ncbi:MAG: hypothetical protein ABI579_07015 [Candidatus Sumerlaeota bacterium]
MCSAVLTLVSARSEDFGGASHKLEYEGEPLRYNVQTPTDPVTRLMHRLAADEATLEFDAQFGYLPALLDKLRIPRSSQTLVFSKTSLQRRFITPDNPRAIFFNDDVYVGFIPGAPALEVSAADTRSGGVFYRLDNEKVRRPQFVRDQNCLDCHGAQRTLGVPGHFVRSIGTDLTGELDGMREVSGIDQCTPLADRWAGWFVTGQHGAQTHRGNLIGPEAFARAAKDTNYLGNLTDLRRFFDVKKHLRPTSDITALMVLEHQAKMHNYITRLNFETQIMTNTYGHIRYLTGQVNAFLRYLLFTEEAPLTARIIGDAEYVREFTAHGPFDAKGRSLRQFDLQTRLFKHPCSFLIYSAQFDALPPVMRDHLLQRLHAILTGQDHDSQFARLAAADRQAILEILRETKPTLPDYWRR